MDVTFFAAPEALRGWLAENHDRAGELWVGFHKKQAGRSGISYAEALDEALAFGWIDGVRKRIDDASYAIRFSPRKPGSVWSAVNIARVEELAKLGRMRPSGLAAFDARRDQRSRQYSYEQGAPSLDAESEQVFRANAAAWDFFQAQAPSYRRAALWWVVSAKRDETRRKRLATLIADSAAGRRPAHLTRQRPSS